MSTVGKNKRSKSFFETLKNSKGVKAGEIVLISGRSIRRIETKEEKNAREEFERNRGKDYVYPSSIRVSLKLQEK